MLCWVPFRPRMPGSPLPELGSRIGWTRGVGETHIPYQVERTFSPARFTGTESQRSLDMRIVVKGRRTVCRVVEPVEEVPTIEEVRPREVLDEVERGECGRSGGQKRECGGAHAELRFMRTVGADVVAVWW